MIRKLLVLVAFFGTALAVITAASAQRDPKQIASPVITVLLSWLVGVSIGLASGGMLLTLIITWARGLTAKARLSFTAKCLRDDM